MTVLIIILAILITTIIFVILNNIFGRLLDGICSFIGAIPIIGDIKDIIFLFISFFLTAIIMTIGLRIFNLEIYVSHPTENSIETINLNEQTKVNTANDIISKIQNINVEEIKLFESFQNLDDSEIDKQFTEFYKKYLLNYRPNFVYNSPTKLLTDLKKLNLKYYEDKKAKTITIADIPLLYYQYNESFEGFIPDFDYLIERYNKILSPAWTSYFALLSNEELDSSDINTYPANEDGVRVEFCKKWNQEWQDFLYKYPDFPLKKEINENINSNIDLLKMYGGI